MSVPRDAPVLLRTSERLAFRRCPMRWEWGTNQGLTPKAPALGALWFGTGIHLALAKYYLQERKRGPHPAKTWAGYCKEEYIWVRTDDEDFIKAKELGLAMMEGYVEKYGKDKDWDVIAPERTGLVRVPHPDRPGEFIVTYAFTFDLVFRCLLSGKIKLGEHKTAAQITLRHLTLDDQAGSYIPMATTLLRAEGLLKADERIEEIVYNFMRKALPETDPRPRDKEGRFLNADGTVSKRQSTRAPLFVRETVQRTTEERNTQVRRIQAEALHMEAFRAGKLPLYKNTNRDCSWDCDFFSMCELHESGGDWEGLRDATMTTRDPNRPYRKVA